MNEINVKIKIEKNSKAPVYMTNGSSGADVRSCVDIIIKKGETKLIPTGIYIEIPFGYECQIRARSGIALKNEIIIMNAPGTIDSDYRGEIKIIMHNLGDNDFIIKKGDRIAQMVFCPVVKAKFLVSDLSETERNENGFGHTDK